MSVKVEKFYLPQAYELVTVMPSFVLDTDEVIEAAVEGYGNTGCGVSEFRECVSTGAAGAQTRRSLGHHLLHPLILRLLVLCAVCTRFFETQISPGCTCTRRSK